MSAVLTPMSLRQSLNMPSQSLKVPIFATLPGIMPLLNHIQPNCFQFRIVLDRMCSEFAAEARTLVAAERQRCIHQPVGVDPYRPGLQPSGDDVSLLYVARPHRRSEAIGIVVGLFDDLI